MFYFVVRPVFLASLGAPRTRGASSSSFCLCILHTRCQTFSRCSEPIKADDVYWRQYKPRVKRGWVCGVRLCWEPKVHEACIITYIDKIKICPLVCLLFYHIQAAIIKIWRICLKLSDLKCRLFRIVEISFGGTGRNLRDKNLQNNWIKVQRGLAMG